PHHHCGAVVAVARHRVEAVEVGLMLLDHARDVLEGGAHVRSAHHGSLQRLGAHSGRAGASTSRRSSPSSAVTVSERPAISSDVTYSPTSARWSSTPIARNRSATRRSTMNAS